MADDGPLTGAEPPDEPVAGGVTFEDCVPFEGEVVVPPGFCVGEVRSVGLGDGFTACVPFRCPADDPDAEDPDAGEPDTVRPEPEATFDAPEDVAEAGDELDDGGGVGSLHFGAVLEKLLVVAPVPE